ncbi:hypothetical protein ACIA49_31820 [Kribbella sp. NPDC051587]|uniref:hypothetical protein n=1 Tax=Kribbella sp. NPDC051587 TaxID=3364119 RepID=UPI0037BC423C
MRELLTQYVDEQTPEEAPPFEYVERAARGRKTRNRVTATLVTGVVVAAGGMLAVIDRPQAADPAPAGPEMVITQDVRTGELIVPGLLDDGPPPKQFKYGKTTMVLASEVRIVGVNGEPDHPEYLTVQLPHDATSSSVSCLPDTVVRILRQDDTSIRVAAYRYRPGGDEAVGQQCFPVRIEGRHQVVQLNLRRLLGARTVYAGAAGKRILQY